MFELVAVVVAAVFVVVVDLESVTVDLARLQLVATVLVRGCIPVEFRFEVEPVSYEAATAGSTAKPVHHRHQLETQRAAVVVGLPQLSVSCSTAVRLLAWCVDEQSALVRSSQSNGCWPSFSSGPVAQLCVWQQSVLACRLMLADNGVAAVDVVFVRMWTDCAASPAWDLGPLIRALNAGMVLGSGWLRERA